MLPSEKLNKNTSKLSGLIGSRAYTFMDTYMYMRNSRYNTVYEKNKQILIMENQAIYNKSFNLLYNAFMEQTRILDSIVVRMRNFAMDTRQEVVSNIDSLMPSAKDIDDFNSAVASIGDNFTKFKYVHYDVQQIRYADLNKFYSLFKNEVKEFIDTGIDNRNPVIHGYATKYLLDTTREYANATDNSLLALESLKVMDVSKLPIISRFFSFKGQLLTTINYDFKIYQFYLRQYRFLNKLIDFVKPIEDKHGKVTIGNIDKEISFTDYLLLYKHFSSIIKFMLDTVNFYDTKFFNKLYAIQSNIEIYHSIMNRIIDMNEKENSMNESIESLINGNDQSMSMLMDNINVPEEHQEPKPNEEIKELIPDEVYGDIAYEFKYFCDNEYDKLEEECKKCTI